MNDEQFELPLTPKLEQVEIDRIPKLLTEQLKSSVCEIKNQTSEELEISVIGSGVGSFFKVNLFTLKVTIDTEKGHDTFDNTVSDSFTEANVRPLETAEEITETRKETLEQILSILDDPDLIENYD